MSAQRLRLLLSVVVLATFAACVSPDSPTTPPAAPPRADLLGGVVGTVTGTVETTVSTVSKLLSPYPCTTKGYGPVTRTIGFGGGIIRVGPHSLSLPPGAVSGPTEITATAPKGEAIRVDFQPEGLRFQRQPLLRLSYEECASAPLLPRIVYVDDGLNLLEILNTVNDVFSQSATARIKHFSGYMLWE